MAVLEDTTKKLTKAEACARLAGKLGWQGLFQIRSGEWHGIHPTRTTYLPIPDFFASRDAAAELVAYFCEFGQAGTIVQFARRITESVEFVSADGVFSAAPTSGFWFVFAGLLATPDQITRAACAALGIELQDESNLQAEYEHRENLEAIRRGLNCKESYLNGGKTSAA